MIVTPNDLYQFDIENADCITFNFIPRFETAYRQGIVYRVDQNGLMNVLTRGVWIKFEGRGFDAISCSLR